MDSSSRGTFSSISVTKGPVLPSLLLRLVDIGLISILFFAPLFMGGRHPTGRLVFVSIVAVMCTAWFLRQCLIKSAVWRATAGQWIFLAAIGLVILQLVPLSPDWAGVLSPSTESLLPLWSSAEQTEIYFGDWEYVSLNPQMTLYGLSILFAYGLTFLVTVQRVETIADVQKLLKWIALATISMAVLGLGQYVSTGDKFLWTYEHPFRKADGIQGPFINPNHFCHLLALGLGPCVGWLIIKLNAPDKDRPLFLGRGKSRGNNFYTTMVASGAGVVVFTGFLSLSRGGILAFVVAIATVTVIYGSKRLIGRRCIFGAVGALLFGGILFAIHGGDKIVAELESLKLTSLDEADYKQMRQAIWKANGLAIQSRPWLGHGVGTHRDFYKIYLDKPFPVEFSHAESGYMQVGSEAGAVGLGLLLLGLMTSCFWCVGAFWKNQKTVEVMCIGAVAASLTVSVVHSVVDFVWYIPACMSWTVLFCALACRLYQIRRASPQTTQSAAPRVAWFCAAIIVAVLCTGSVCILVPPAQAAYHWDQFQVYAKERARLEMPQVTFANQTEKQKEVMRLTTSLDKKMEEALLRYSAIDMDNATVHLRIAANYLRQFQAEQRSSKNPMDVGQIRDAAIASKFPSKESLDAWLARAIGDHRNLLHRALWHARQAAMRCPLQGEAYLFLGELAFLEGAGHAAKSNLIEQALRVRPYDSKVLLMAGKEAAIAGEVQTAIEYWRRSFKYGIDGKRDLIDLLSQRIPTEFTLQILEPKAKDVVLFCLAYQRLKDPTQMKLVCDHFHQLLLQEEAGNGTTSKGWRILSECYLAIDQTDSALRCAEFAIKSEANRFDTHLLLGSIFLKKKAFTDAEYHLRWCVSRRPAHSQSQKLLMEAVKQRIATKESWGQVEQKHK